MPVSKKYEITTHPAVGPKVVVTIESTSIDAAAAQWALTDAPIGMSTFIKMVGGKRGYDIQRTNGYYLGRRSIER